MYAFFLVKMINHMIYLISTKQSVDFRIESIVSECNQTIRLWGSIAHWANLANWVRYQLWAGCKNTVLFL